MVRQLNFDPNYGDDGENFGHLATFNHACIPIAGHLGAEGKPPISICFTQSRHTSNRSFLGAE
jgi:hypothetical protein